LHCHSVAALSDRRGHGVPEQEDFEVIGAGGLGQFGEESREVRMRLPEWDRIVYLYSDFGAIDTMPELRQRKLRTWVQTRRAIENEQANGGYKVTISLVYVK